MRGKEERIQTLEKMIEEYHRGIAEALIEIKEKKTSNTALSSARFRVKAYNERIKELEEKVSKLKGVLIEKKIIKDRKTNKKPKISYTSEDFDQLDV